MWPLLYWTNCDAYATVPIDGAVPGIGGRRKGSWGGSSPHYRLYGSFLRPSGWALMAMTPAEKQRRFRERQKATDGGAGELGFAKLLIAELTKERDWLRARVEVLEARLGPVTGPLPVTKSNVTVPETGTVLLAVDASHNRAHALSDSESLLGSYMNEKKDVRLGSQSGDPDQYGAHTGAWEARCRALGLSHVDPLPVTKSNALPKALQAPSQDSQGATSEEIEIVLGRGETRKISLAQALTDEQKTERKRLQTEAALRWAAEQEQKGAAE